VTSLTGLNSGAATAVPDNALERAGSHVLAAAVQRER